MSMKPITVGMRVRLENQMDNDGQKTPPPQYVKQTGTVTAVTNMVWVKFGDGETFACFVSQLSQ